MCVLFIYLHFIFAMCRPGQHNNISQVISCYSIGIYVRKIKWRFVLLDIGLKLIKERRDSPDEGGKEVDRSGR